MRILSTYLGHESNMTVWEDGKITIVELDKLTSDKWCQLERKGAPVYIAEVLEEAFSFCGGNEFDIWINGSMAYGNRNGCIWPQKYKNIIKAKRIIEGPGHHELHAYCALFQSPFDKALIISSDGGGNDGVFSIYRADKELGIQLFEKIDRFDFGTFYGLLGSLSREINEKYNFLNIAGKAMGLAAMYKPTGTAEEKKIRKAITKAYASGGYKYFVDKYRLPITWKERNVAVKNPDRPPYLIEDNYTTRAICYYSQRELQNKMNQIITDRTYELFSRYDGNLILTGGVAMNVVMNEFVKNTQGANTFIPCNPSDRGLSLGGLYWYMYLTGMDVPSGSLHNAGIPLIGDGPIDPSKRKTPIKTIANMIKKGKIIGIAEGNSEIGQRALGYRSIVCDPSIPGIKDRLNKQIKHREPFRPFAPIVLEEHLDYFKSYSKDNLEYMSYALETTKEFQEKYPAVTHVDGTARVQVVTDKNSTVYKLLKEIGTPLLNTSFNIQGQPIIARESEAFAMLKAGGLDAILVHGVLYKKPVVDK